MSAPGSPASPRRHYSGGQIAMIVVGVILLLPGLCSLGFAIAMSAEIRLSDPIVQGILMLWAACFAVSALGIVLIVVARKRARGTR